MLKNRLIYSFMILLSLISLAFTGSRGSFVLLVALLLIALVSLALLFVSWLGIQCSQELSEGMIMKSEYTNYSAKIWCRYFSYCIVQAGFILPSQALVFGAAPEDGKADTDFFLKSLEEFELYAGDKVSFSCEVKSFFRCVSPIGLEYVEMYDFLKIWKLRKKIKDSAILIVCPNVVPFSDELFSYAPSEEAGISRKASFEDYSSVTDVRKYEFADSMKRVHWKLSAKKNELLVKNFDHANTMVTAIILDNRQSPDFLENPAAVEDSLVETAVSIIKYNLDDSYPVMFDFMDGAVPSRVYESGGAGFDRLYFAASSVRIDALEVESLFNEYYNPNFLISALYVMTTNPDKKVSAFLKAMAINGLDVNVIHFFEKNHQQKAKDFDETGVNYYGVSLENRESSGNSA